MSGEAKWLLIDIGNTSIKYVIVDAKTDPEQLDVKQTENLNTLNNILARVDHVAIASVREPENLSMFINYLHIQGKKVHIAQTKKIQKVGSVHLQNSYKTLTNMGVDRWLAMVAGVYFAERRAEHNVLVVDAGTAVTCDVIVSHVHKGGFIAPGLNMLKQALYNNTEKVFGADDTPETIKLGTDTPECVDAGCLAQIEGVVKQAQEQMQNYAEKYLLLISGGDQRYLANLEQNPKMYIENAVLSGLCITFVQD